MSAQQAALQQDIQQLLKELNTELKQMQADMGQSSDQSAPPPGTETDSNLYGDATPLDPAGGAPMPIQFDVDEQAGPSAKRKGSGTGKPSGKVSAEAPQAVAEDVAAAEQSQQESAVSRQPIPPDYQSVFEHASKNQ